MAAQRAWGWKYCTQRDFIYNLQRTISFCCTTECYSLNASCTCIQRRQWSLLQLVASWRKACVKCQVRMVTLLHRDRCRRRPIPQTTCRLCSCALSPSLSGFTNVGPHVTEDLYKVRRSMCALSTFPLQPSVVAKLEVVGGLTCGYVA